LIESDIKRLKRELAGRQIPAKLHPSRCSRD
jgi:hypothetical protein